MILKCIYEFYVSQQQFLQKIYYILSADNEKHFIYSNKFYKQKLHISYIICVQVNSYC